MHAEYENQVHSDAQEALVEFSRDSALANGNRYLEEEIEELEKELGRLDSGEWGKKGKSWLFEYLRRNEGDD